MTDAFKVAVQDIFRNNNKLIKSQKIGASESLISKKELELAVAVLLVDLASSDQSFDMQEYNTIISGIHRIFGTSREEIQSLINQATLVIKNLRGTSKFATLIKESLALEEREKIMSVIDDVICADGLEDGYETYLRHKFADILEVQLKPLNIPTKPS